MAYKKHLLNPKLIQSPNQIADNMEGGVGSMRSRGVRVAIASEVRRDGSIPDGGKVEKLVAPWVPQLGEAMKKKNDGAIAYWGNMHFDAISVDGGVLNRIHGKLTLSISASSLNFWVCQRGV